MWRPANAFVPSPMAAHRIAAARALVRLCSPEARHPNAMGVPLLSPRRTRLGASAQRRRVPLAVPPPITTRLPAPCRAHRMVARRPRCLPALRHTPGANCRACLAPCSGRVQARLRLPRPPTRQSGVPQSHPTITRSWSGSSAQRTCSAVAVVLLSIWPRPASTLCSASTRAATQLLASSKITPTLARCGCRSIALTRARTRSAPPECSSPRAPLHAKAGLPQATSAPTTSATC